MRVERSQLAAAAGEQSSAATQRLSIHIAYYLYLLPEVISNASYLM